MPVNDIEFELLKARIQVMAVALDELSGQMNQHTGGDFGAASSDDPHPNTLSSISGASFIGGSFSEFHSPIKIWYDAENGMGGRFITLYQSRAYSGVDYGDELYADGLAIRGIYDTTNGLRLMTALSTEAGLVQFKHTLIDLYLTAGGVVTPESVGRVNIQKGRIALTGKLNFSNHTTADEGSMSLTDGDVWYNSTTDKYRGRANGATEDFAYVSDISSGFTMQITSGNYNAQADDFVLASNSVTITLPAAASYIGRSIGVGNRGTGIITVARTGGDTINGAALNMTLIAGEQVVYIADATDNDWRPY